MRFARFGKAEGCGVIGTCQTDEICKPYLIVPTQQTFDDFIDSHCQTGLDVECSVEFVVERRTAMSPLSNEITTCFTTVNVVYFITSGPQPPKTLHNITYIAYV